MSVANKDGFVRYVTGAIENYFLTTRRDNAAGFLRR